MMMENPEGYRSGEHLEGVAVEAEAEGAGKNHEACLLPVAAAVAENLHNSRGLVLDALHGERLEPVCDGESGDIRELSGASYGIKVGFERRVCAEESFRHGDLHLRYERTVGAVDPPVGHPDYMKDDAVVCGIVLMTVSYPVGSLDMYLHISGPFRAVDLNFGIEEVGPGVGVQASGIDDSNLSSTTLPEGAAEHSGFPEILI